MVSTTIRIFSGLLLAPLAAILTSSVWSLHAPGEQGERLIWSAVLFGVFWTGFTFLAWWPTRAWHAGAILVALCTVAGAIVGAV